MNHWTDEVRQFADVYSADELAALAYEMDYIRATGKLPDDAVIIEWAELIDDAWLFVHRERPTRN